MWQERNPSLLILVERKYLTWFYFNFFLRLLGFLFMAEQEFNKRIFSNISFILLVIWKGIFIIMKAEEELQYFVFFLLNTWKNICFFIRIHEGSLVILMLYLLRYFLFGYFSKIFIYNFLYYLKQQIHTHIHTT